MADGILFPQFEQNLNCGLGVVDWVAGDWELWSRCFSPSIIKATLSVLFPQSYTWKRAEELTVTIVVSGFIWFQSALTLIDSPQDLAEIFVLISSSLPLSAATFQPLLAAISFAADNTDVGCAAKASVWDLKFSTPG